MSAVVETITDLPKNIAAEVKKEATTAPTKEGITNQVVGFALGVPIAMFYDWLYEMLAAKVITNVMARNVLKVAAPLGVGLVFQFAKIPFGNIVAGTGYAVAILSAVKMIYTFIKEKLGKSTADTAERATGYKDGIPTILDSLWGVQQ